LLSFVNLAHRLPRQTYGGVKLQMAARNSEKIERSMFIF